ncbi:MAG TPA: site-specific integrase [Candidatus Dormibacteraeota bacterium]|nr:site-specific integrase [Candidatus Dormibacteraeota bacterium]
MKQRKPTKTWERTRLQNLIRHKSGGYYARAFAGGKEVWKSLKTSHFSVAHAKLAEFLKEHRERVSNGNGEVSAKMTFGQAAAIHLRNLDDNLGIKSRTRDYWRECLVALQKSWPGLNETEARKITQTECKEWARAYRKTVSPTRYNNTVSILRHVLNVAVEAGVVYNNAAAAVKRAPVRAKEISLPTIDKFNALIAEMRAGHGRDSINCADFASGLAFTGCRVGEAREIALRDIDFDAGEIVVRGDSKTGTKNWELRRVPLIPDARALFERMRGERPGESVDTKVFRVSECQKALDRACKKTGIDRITHHDLRHLFATRCIESGVDIPTVSRWLGHKDGGALAMKTYGHLRREHSIAQAQRVSFTPVTTKRADVIAFPVTA